MRHEAKERERERERIEGERKVRCERERLGKRYGGEKVKIKI